MGNTSIKLPLKRVHMELTNLCNFDCTFCPKNIMTRAKGMMEKATALKIIDEIVENNISEKLTFHIMGEPMLHPDFYEILTYCNKKGLKVGITTNGVFLDTERLSWLEYANIDQINISLQTPDKESYELRKSKGLGFDEYKGQILNFINILRVTNGNSKIKIHLLNTRFGGKLKGLMNGKEIISNNKLLRDTLSDWTEDIFKLPALSQEAGLKKKVLTNIKKLVTYKWNVLEIAPNIFIETYHLDSWGNTLSDGRVYESAYGYCSALTDHFGILWNGDLILCCKDFDGKTIMGNVKSGTIISLLESEELLKIYNGFNKYKVIHPFCKKCLGGSSKISARLKQLNSILLWKILKGYFYNEKRMF